MRPWTPGRWAQLRAKRRHARRNPGQLLLALAVLALAGCADMPRETVQEEAAYQVLAAADAAETLNIADNPARFQERNPVMGPHPQPGRVAGYFAVCGVAHAGVTYALTEAGAPRWAVRAWEVSGLSLEAVMLANNAHEGIAPTLSFHINLGAPPAARAARH